MNVKVMATTLIFLLFYTTVTEAKVVKVRLSEVTKQNSKYFILKNKLRVYIISDPDSDISSASVSMILGQGDTPDELPGLPHVLEHTLFLGTEHYPQMTDWSDFFKPKGWSNGSTRSDVSRYHFQIGSSHFQEGLKRLHDLLFNPLLREKGIRQALEEVENEYQNKNNEWRKLLSVMRGNVNPEHPLAVFGTGNNDSLGQYTNVMHKELMALYHRYYHPENMALVVYHSASLKEIEDHVRFVFAETPTQYTYERRPAPVLLLKEQTENIIKVSTDSAKFSLDLRFEIPARTTNVDAILPEYLSEYLHESIKNNSNYEALVTHASLAFQGDMYTGLADIYLELTSKGNEQPERVINLINNTLKEFRHDIKRSEIQNKLCIGLKAHQKGRVQEIGDWLSDISDQMIRRKSITYSDIEYCPAAIPAKSIEKFISYLTRENMQVFHVTDKKFNANGVSKFYNVPFSSQKLK